MVDAWFKEWARITVVFACFPLNSPSPKCTPVRGGKTNVFSIPSLLSFPSDMICDFITSCAGFEENPLLFQEVLYYNINVQFCPRALGRETKEVFFKYGFCKKINR